MSPSERESMGIGRPMPPARIVVSNGLNMAVHEAGEGPPVMLLHGFPELAYSWRYQIPALAAGGWRAIAPDLRGYGGTGPRGGVEAYAMRNLARDIVGLLDALALPHAVIVGHDFGGALGWTLARDHPDRVAGIASLNTPYTRRGAEDLVATMRRHRGPENYMVRFQEPGVGEALLERDLAATFAGLIRRPRLTLAGFTAEPGLAALPMTLFVGEPAVMGEPLLGPDDLAVYVEAFRRTGFTGPLNWYRALHRNWLDTAGIEDQVRVPALMVSAADDWFLPPATTTGMEGHVSDLECRVIAGCGHWTQQERPVETNRLLLDWLERRMRPLF